ncbi:MAG: hypothetical protein ABI729_07330, partial [Chitinophagales bacterium]
MICTLCQKSEANKKNTHYLTDGIIRNCLNLDGHNGRERGFYFDLSNSKTFVEFNFQRATSIEKLESSLGRPITDEEIEKAKATPYSVDYVFCTECEDIFTAIEDRFISEILPKFRSANLSDIEKVEITDLKVSRLFFYLQIWRTSICSSLFRIPEAIKEDIRQMILHFDKIEENNLTGYPIAVTYLETLGEEAEYTTNFVGLTDDENPYIIIMNDFVIQFYESKESIIFLEFFGLNSESNFKEFINLHEKKFIVRVIDNSARKKFLYNFAKNLADQKIESYNRGFTEAWTKCVGSAPSSKIKEEYLKAITGGNE